MKILTRGGIILVSLILSFGIVEKITRSLFPPPLRLSRVKVLSPYKKEKEKLVAEEKPGNLLYQETPLGIRLRPNVEILVKNAPPEGRDILIRTNSLGYRNPEIGEKTKPRILFLGDSITMGYNLPEEETFVKIIEKISQHTDKKVETINAGVLGASLREELAILMETGIQTSPDIVVLGFYLNDFKPSRGVKLVRLPAFLDRSWFLYYLLQGVLSLPPISKREEVDTLTLNEWRAKARKRFPPGGGDPDKDPKAFNQLIMQNFRDWGIAWSEEAWVFMSPYFREFKELSERHGFIPLIVVFPVKWQVTANYLYDFPQRRLRKITENLKIKVLDLLPYLRKFALPARKKLFYDQCHLTPYGNQVVARIIWEFLYPEIEGLQGRNKLTNQKL